MNTQWGQIAFTVLSLAIFAGFWIMLVRSGRRNQAAAGDREAEYMKMLKHQNQLMEEMLAELRQLNGKKRRG